MKPTYQTVVNVDMDNATCMVKSARGNIYPADINRLNKTIKTGDDVLVTKGLDGRWVVVDVEPKYPYANPLDITQFPRTESNDLNHVEYYRYRKIFDGLRSDRERNEMNTFLIDLFKEKYGYDALRNVEPESQATLEEYL